MAPSSKKKDKSINKHTGTQVIICFLSFNSLLINLILERENKINSQNLIRRYMREIRHIAVYRNYFTELTNITVYRQVIFLFSLPFHSIYTDS